jgi:hypothetical protein
MFRSWTASILFCLALLLQASAPVASGAAMDVSEIDAPGPEFVLCRLLHGGASAIESDLNAPARPDRAPAPGGTHHHHSACWLCQSGSNAAFYYPYVAPIAGPTTAWMRTNCIPRAERAVEFYFSYGARARAPPSVA